MNVAFISTFKEIGGISIHTRELLRKFRERGHQVTVIPLAVLWPQPLAMEHYLWSLNRGFDIVNVQGTSEMAAIAAGLLASKTITGGCVCTSHGFSPPRWYGRSLTRELMRGALGRYGALISISKYVENRLRQFFEGRAPKLYTVYDGVDTDLFNPAVDPTNLRQHLGLRDKKVILYSGRLTEKKGAHHLLKAFSILCKESPGVGLVYCGRGAMEAELKGMAKDLGVANRVIFTGPVPHHELARYYAMCNVLAVPSTYENLGLAPMEAMSAGRSVVASGTGGLPEVVENMRTGVLVPPGDPEALADALLRVISDDELASRLGTAGRSRVLEKFSLERCTDATIAVFESVLRHAE
jgi:glycosyltransferase involved in cell wall biosynthesis